jgi:hypothetical protein
MQSLMDSEFTILNAVGAANTMAHFDMRFIDQDYNYSTSVGPVSALFDTGALCASYISSRLFQVLKRKRLVLDKDIVMCKTRVGLADNCTTVTSDCMVRLTVDFQGVNTTWTRYFGWFVVLDMKETQVILGLPAIMKDLWPFFVKNLNLRKRDPLYIRGIQEQLNHMQESIVSDLRSPWSTPADDEAPEEQAVDQPVQFECAQGFLGKSYEQAVSDFHAQMDEHISPDMKKKTNIVQLLSTKGLSVFVPKSWDGITGLGELELNFKDTLPDKLKPRARRINPTRYDNAEKEFKRMQSYFYVKSDSPHASCLVIAPKATSPFLRLCGDYVEINKYILTGHYNIPVVKDELDKIIRFKYFLDIDLTNAFHQIPLARTTSDRLSIQTPWGQFRPLFLPEGVGPGSGKLQETVRELFSEFSDWAIVIFDNILILADDEQDGYDKLELFLDKCIKHNVVLKFAKSWLGFQEVNFFGYKCVHNSYSLTSDRKQAILDIPFPEDGNRQKKMRMFLGSSGFFQPFMPDYVNLRKHLTDATKADFDWKEANWKYPYRTEFRDFKEGLQKSVSIFFPDYSLKWVVRTDASEFGVGGMIIQLFINVDASISEQIIAVCSQKFSPQAQKWTTIEQEGYGIYYTVNKFEYYLRGIHFTIETDHNNLRWMEASLVPKIVRWRIYLQSFDFDINHIPGPTNVVADAFSRLFRLSHWWSQVSPSDTQTLNALQLAIDSEYEFLGCLSNLYSPDTTAPPKEYSYVDGDSHSSTIDSPQPSSMTPQQIFDSIHSATTGHWGAAETWRRMNKLAPGHGLSMQQVHDLVQECVNCQKNRRRLSHKLVPITRTLKPPESRSAIGIDAVTITPPGKNGETHIYVVVNLFTKMVSLEPVKGVTIPNVTLCIWKHWTNFGHTDLILSDLGPELNSKLMSELVKLMGMRHAFSIADRHSNGVERTIAEVTRHLRAMAYDKNNLDIFGDPFVIPTMQYICNSHASSETSCTPFELTYGSHDVVYKDLLTQASTQEPAAALLKRLNDNLTLLRRSSSEYQTSLVKQRKSSEKESEHNRFQPGDFVMFDSGSKVNPKLASRNKGPYKVIVHRKNDVQIRDLVTDAVRTYSVHDLEPFYGTLDQAVDAARHDDAQHVMTRVISYNGNCNRRTEMSFVCEFADGDITERIWTPDIECTAYYDFCESKPYLKHLCLPAAMATKHIAAVNKLPITTVQPGDCVYVDIRFLGDRWYESLDMPSWQTSSYVLKVRYTHWFHAVKPRAKSNRTPSTVPKQNVISCEIDLDPNITYHLTHYQVKCWGEQKIFNADTMILVDRDIVSLYPSILM